MKRLLSLDFMRGFIMVLLMLESAGLFEPLYKLSEHTFFESFFIQFFHHPWHGLRFWDLIQPGFMFMAGTAMAYSLHKQEKAGIPWTKTFVKTLKRSAWLFFWGVLDYAVRKTGLSFELWDVLTQLSVTTLIAFFIFRWNYLQQILFSIGLLLLTEVLYRYTNIPNFNQPFADQHNFGNFMDLVLMNKINKGGWVAINCLPTAVHTIAGALVGKILLQDKKPLSSIYMASVCCLVVGYGLDLFDITPIIKRIATTSFTLASLGYCLAALGACFWWIDVKKHQTNWEFFTIVGMNSIFIYLFFEIVGHRWFNGYVEQITTGLLLPLQLNELVKQVVTALAIFGLEWGMCYFLYRKKIFFKV